MSPVEHAEASRKLLDLIARLNIRAHIRRQIPGRKSVQLGQPDRIADLLSEAADALEEFHRTYFSKGPE